MGRSSWSPCKQPEPQCHSQTLSAWGEPSRITRLICEILWCVDSQQPLYLIILYQPVLGLNHIHGMMHQHRAAFKLLSHKYHRYFWFYTALQGQFCVCVILYYWYKTLLWLPGHVIWVGPLQVIIRPLWWCRVSEECSVWRSGSVQFFDPNKGQLWTITGPNHSLPTLDRLQLNQIQPVLFSLVNLKKPVLAGFYYYFLV